MVELASVLKVELFREDELVHLHLSNNILVLKTENERRIYKLGERLRVDSEVETGCRIEVVFVVADDIVIVQLDVLRADRVGIHVW